MSQFTSEQEKRIISRANEIVNELEIEELKEEKKRRTKDVTRFTNEEREEIINQISTIKGYDISKISLVNNVPNMNGVFIEIDYTET